MTKIHLVLTAMALSLASSAVWAQAAILPAQRGAVFITKDDFAKALAARASGSALGVVGAVRAGDDRINIDVLNSQQQVFSTRRDLSKARYDTIMNGLRLKAAAGSLTEADVEEVNRLLGG